ncbi:MAG: hypothetical protein M0P14_05275 [Alkaliphilus sp.]|nr:hypothetical protein [Alkaliphilus sp.]
MFEETEKMMKLFEEADCKKILAVDIAVSKNKFTVAANGMYENKIRIKF